MMADDQHVRVQVRRAATQQSSSTETGDGWVAGGCRPQPSASPTRKTRRPEASRRTTRVFSFGSECLERSRHSTVMLAAAPRSMGRSDIIAERGNRTRRRSAASMPAPLASAMALATASCARSSTSTPSPSSARPWWPLWGSIGRIWTTTPAAGPCRRSARPYSGWRARARVRCCQTAWPSFSGPLCRRPPGWPGARSGATSRPPDLRPITFEHRVPPPLRHPLQSPQS